MKISNETLQILKNFTTINPSYVFREGNVVSSISVGNNIFARATVTEEFPQEVCIYDLNSLLGLLTLQEGQDVEFGENSIIISKDNGQFEYFYSDASNIRPEVAKWPQKTPSAEGFYTFTLGATEIQTINKAATVVGATKFGLSCKGGKVQINVNDPKTPGSNSYRKFLEDYDGDDFDAFIPFENFKVVNDSYDVTVSKKRFFHFKNNNRDLAYWFALDIDAKV